MPDPLTVPAGEFALLTSARLAESAARDAISNNLSAQLKTLFPTAPATFLQSNSDLANELARGAGEIADAVSAAVINWTGPAKDAGVKKTFSKDLVRLLAVDALVSGKLALFPRVDEAGVFRLEALTGYLHPLLNAGNALGVDVLLQVLTVADKDEVKYEVRAYRPGLLEVYPAVADVTEFAKGEPKSYPQPHAGDALPVAFRIVRRDAYRRPYGLISEALSAFRRYLKTAVNTSAAQDIAAFPERVLKSSEYLRMLQSGDPMRPGSEHPAVTAIKQTGPRLLKLIDSGDDYEVNPGIDLAPHMAKEASDKHALLDVLKSADLSGGNLTGIALAERQSKSRQVVIDLCDSIADLVTEACALAEGLPGANVGAGIEASLTPRFPTDRGARVLEVTQLFQAGAIPKSVLYTELQALGYESITDNLINAALGAETADLIPELDNADTVTA